MDNSSIVNKHVKNYNKPIRDLLNTEKRSIVYWCSWFEGKRVDTGKFGLDYDMMDLYYYLNPE